MNRIRYARGFTMIEVIVVIGLFSMVGGLALFVSMDAYRGDTFRADRDLLVAALQRARAQSIHNVCLWGCIDGKTHGVSIGQNTYTIFEGASYATRDSVVDVTLSASPDVSRTLGEVVFSQLSGATSPATITLAVSGHSSVITVSSEGQITWTN